MSYMNNELTTPIWRPYSLVNGYIHEWLTIGPFANPVHNLEQFSDDSLKPKIAESLYTADSGVESAPVELATVSPFDSAQEYQWEMVTCDVDHFIDASAFYHTCHHVQNWAYTVIDSSTAGKVTFTLTTNGPADFWLNDQHVHRQSHFAHQIPKSVSFVCELQAGQNHLLVRFEGVAIRECPHVMALRVESADLNVDGLTVQIPSTIEPLESRQRLEETFSKAQLLREVFLYDEQIELRWPTQEPCTSNICMRVQEPTGRIYAEFVTEGKTTYESKLGVAYQFNEGPHKIILMPHPDHYYLRGMKVKREIPVTTVRNRYSMEPYGTIEERRKEALDDAAMRNTGLYSQIAQMAVGRWSRVNTKAILAIIDKVNKRADCSDFDMVGLLGMVGRYWDEKDFPAEIQEPLKECILNFRYWMDEPGNDAMCYWSENHQILFHTCEIIAGQLFEDDIFPNSGMTGAAHVEAGEKRALSWLQKRASGGFREWDSNTYFEEDVLALTHLVDFAASDEVAELAALVLDKIFLSLAVNSFKGVFGSTHGRAYTSSIKSGYLEATAGLSRFLWGMGIFNRHIIGTVSLACCANYSFPLIISEIAADLPDELWSKERHAGEMEKWCDKEIGQWEVNKVTYKTPDYMLCSAQDYRAGEEGYQQHIWQATFSPDAVVFVNHPACISEDNAHRPGFWHGNVTLPRTAQWKDVLISVHNAPEDDWMGFTHAYFPTYAFDRWKITDNWAIAQVGDGYIALTAANGLELISSGNNAQREIRSPGYQNTWLCMMGRKAIDGSYHEFTKKVLALDVTLNPQGFHGDTLRGETIDFGWQGPLLVNEREELITGFKHIENPYCETELASGQMEVRFGDQIMRLHLDSE